MVFKESAGAGRVVFGEVADPPGDGFLNEPVGVGDISGGPAEDTVAEAFDFDTAQLHDVTKLDQEDGSVKYLSVLVDAQGRTMDVEMSGEEGETAYQTMQTLKKFPLAERVYRQIAMPLIDQAIAASDATEKLTPSSESARKVPPAAQPGEGDRDPLDEATDADTTGAESDLPGGQ